MADRGDALGRAWRSVRGRGAPASAALAVEEVAGLLRFGRRTGGRARAGAALDDDARPLETTRFRTLRRVLAATRAEVGSGGFVDLGCGRGRALVAARRAGFEPVLGVEIDPVVAAEARRNVPAGVRVTAADARAAEVPDSTVVVFLFNPFGRSSVAEVADRIQESLDRSPRAVVVAYVNPVHEDVFLGAGFRRVWADHDAVVLRSRES